MKYVFSMLMISVSLLAAPKERAWQTGKLTEMNRGSSTETSGSTGGRIGSLAIPGSTSSIIWYSWEYIIVDNDGRFYVAEPAGGFSGHGAQKAFEVDVNSQVTFAIEKSDLYLKDRNGKEHKMKIIKQGTK